MCKHIGITKTFNIPISANELTLYNLDLIISKHFLDESHFIHSQSKSTHQVFVYSFEKTFEFIA